MENKQINTTPILENFLEVREINTIEDLQMLETTEITFIPTFGNETKELNSSTEKIIQNPF